MTALEIEVSRCIAKWINYNSLENRFNLPDYVIADMVMDFRPSGMQSNLKGEMEPFEGKSIRQVLLESMLPTSVPMTEGRETVSKIGVAGGASGAAIPARTRTPRPYRRDHRDR